MSSSRIFKKVRYALRFLPDELYIQLNYVARFKRLCNLKNPVTYNEKLNWLKLHDYNPLYTKIVDKYEVKDYIAMLDDNFISNIHIYVQAKNISDRSHYWR